MTDTCNARYPTGLDRCSLAPHDNKTKHLDESTGREWGGKRKQSPLLRSEIKRGKGLKPRSEKQAAKQETWMLIKSSMMMAQERTNGYLSCMQCGRVVEIGGEWLLDLDHIVAAGRGGVWTPGNAILLCRNRADSTKGCHPEKHGVPMFSGSEEEAG